MLSKGVEAAIPDAIERKDFDQLPGAGKRVDLGAYFETPEELRLAYSMLMNAGLLPEGVELLQKISLLQERARLAANDDERRSATRRLSALHLKFNVLIDGPRRKRPAR